MKQTNNFTRRTANILIILAMILISGAAVFAQTSAFTYQGRLTDGANTVPTATYDMKFDLYDADVDGTLIGSVTVSNVFVSQGTFTTSLNFGAAAFDGSERYLEISLRPAGSSAARTTLQPRQRITGAPYSTQSRKATTAVNFSGNLTGDVTGTQTATVVTSVGGETPANIASGAQIANAATSANAPNAVVRRDANGNFAAGAITAANVTLAAGGKVTFADGTQQSTSVDPSLFVVRNQQSGAIKVEDTRVSVITPAQTTDAFRVDNPTIDSNNPIGTIVRFRSGSPLSDRFRFDQAGGFIARGTLGFGVIPVTGAGERMMWYPYKSAFRAGSIGSAGTQWDDANIGFYSWAGGYNTIALGLSSFSMGYQSQALGSYSNALGYTSIADGTGSVAIGYRAIADGDYTTAIGQRATNCSSVTNNVCSGGSYSGVISIADGSTTAYLTATGTNQFNVRAAGGYRLFTNAATTTGVSLSAGGGAWNTISDRNAKENFGAVNSRDILQKILKLPISTWSYKGQNYRHIGAMAQDFYAAFAVGESDKTITTVDPDGVAFAAIQGLSEEMNERAANLKAENERLRVQIAAQNGQIAAQNGQIAAQNKIIAGQAALMNEFEARLRRLEQSKRTPRAAVKRRK